MYSWGYQKSYHLSFSTGSNSFSPFSLHLHNFSTHWIWELYSLICVPSRSTRHIFFTNTYYCSWVMYRMTSPWIRLHFCWISVDQTSSSNLVFGGTIPVDVGRRRSKVHYPRASQLSWLALNYPDSAVSRLLSVNLPSLTRMLKHSQNTFLVSISFSFPLCFYQRGFVFTLQALALNLKNCMKKVLWVIVRVRKRNKYNK